MVQGLASVLWLFFAPVSSAIKMSEEVRLSNRNLCYSSILVTDSLYAAGQACR